MLGLFSNTTAKEAIEKEQEKAAREKMAHTLSIQLSTILCNKTENCSAMEIVAYIVAYLRDYNINKFILQPDEKYSIVLSPSGKSYEFKQE